MTTNLIVQKVNKELSAHLADPNTVRTLLTTTFKNMSEATMKKAVLEGMIRGFEFKDFLNKDVYAISYGNDYSLVTSIDYMRKIASQNGQTGKDAPVYEDNADGSIKTCSVTVYRNGNPFTAKVYFDEYTTGKNQWITKPRTMIAKVAEMHALRMACPDVLSKAYIEEENRGEHITANTVDTENLKNVFEECKTVEELTSTWKSLTPDEQSNKEVIQLAKERKQVILSYGKVKDAEVENTSDGAKVA